MATLVCFHAHPDDESIATGGTMAKAASEGHRVVLVVATRGEHGEPVPGVLDDGEALWQRRVVETHQAAEALGVAAVHFLGYVDSGMMGAETNADAGAFWQADLDEAARRLAVILRDEGCDVLTVYDDHGGYGHPDHIQVHRVGHRAAEIAGVDVVFEVTMNRTAIRRMLATMGSEAEEVLDDELRDEIDDTFGSPEELITHAVDVSGQLAAKRRSLAAHASQIGPDSFFMAMPPDTFAAAFGTEWFIRPGQPRPDGAPFGDDLFAELR
jgi:LmbE family N-acetylglucosaminyl deacetylase